MTLSHSERPLLHVTGLNHKTADVSLRESFAIEDETFNRALEQALAVSGVKEAVVLSTCNRVEFVVAAEPRMSREDVSGGLASVLSRISGVRKNDFGSNLYHLAERSAVSHLFRVASGLDSLVIGEPQVLGQLKEAYERASATGATGGVLHRLFHRAFSVAKAVRTRTTISQNAVSVCYAGRVLAEQIFGDLRDATVMLIGAGEMGSLAVRHFMSAGAGEFVVLNRSLARACDVAELCTGVAGSLEQLPQYLPRADIVIGAATLSAKEPPIVGRSAALASLREREGKPQFFIDLAVPRNFSAELDGISDAYLYNIDDLNQVVDENMSTRRLEAERAETIVHTEVERFWRWFESRHIEESIRELAADYQDFRAREIDKTMRRLQRLGFEEERGDEFRLALEDMSQALLAKALHRPITALKERSADPMFLRVFRELFLGKRNRDIS